jgi:uncharacterized membrane protein
LGGRGIYKTEGGYMPGAQKKDYKTIIVVVLIVIMSFAVRFWGLTAKGLWYDELQSVTHAILPLNELLKSVQIYDPHPPLYYLQLHWWMLLSTTDLWIKLNSVLWSVMTTLLLFIVGKRLFNTEVAIIASTLFSISPYAVAHAQDARMYALLMFFGLLSFIFTYQFLFGKSIWLPGIGIIIATEIFLYSHGSGFMLLVSLYSYITVFFLSDHTNINWKRIAQWCFVQLVILVFYLPWLKHAYSINLGHLLEPSLKTIINTLNVLWFGFGIRDLAVLHWSLFLLILLVIGIAISQKNNNGILISFVIIPVIFCIVVSHLYRPIWLHRTLAYTAPFLSLAMALAIHKLRISRVSEKISLDKIFSLSVIFLYLIGLAFQQLNFRHPWDIKAAVEYVQSEIHTGDVIYIPHERVFWGWLWYFSGPGSVNPLNTDYALVTPRGIRLLAKPAIDNYGVEDRQNYWLVYRRIESVLPFESYLPDITRDFNGLYVEYLRSDLDY